MILFLGSLSLSPSIHLTSHDDHHHHPTSPISITTRLQALAKNPTLRVAARDAAKKREMEAQDAQARAALRAHKASG